MEKLVLRAEVIESIKKDPVLFGAVAEALGVSVFTVITFLRNNDPKLTQASVMKLLRKHLKESKDNALLCEMQVTG